MVTYRHSPKRGARPRRQGDPSSSNATAPHTSKKVTSSTKAPRSSRKPGSWGTTSRPAAKGWSVFGLGSLVGGALSFRGENHRKPSSNEADSNHRSHASGRDKNPPPRRIYIEFKDLDHSRPAARVSVRAGTAALRLQKILRRDQDALGAPFPEDASLHLYAEGRELGPEEVTDGYKVLWYRIRARPSDGKFKFTHHLDETHGRLESDMTEDLEKAINDGATVGELRKKIAEYMRIEDANRIKLYAKDGMRHGMVQGNSWEVRQLRNWLCTWLSVDAAPEREYILFKGLKREYLLHAGVTECRRRGVIQLRKILHRLLIDVVHHGLSKISLNLSDVTLLHEDTRVRRHDPVVLGSVYNFEIPLYAGELFNEEESWLLPVTETCPVCADDKKISEIPIRLSNSCTHPPATCKDCTAQWIQSSLDTSTWDHIKCPECPEHMKFDDVRRYATPETFARYDKLATTAALKEIRDFRWCLSTKCDSGQIHDHRCAKFECAACKARHCVVHNVPWHKKETCEEYDRRNRQKRKDEKASEETVKRMSKACPGCKVATYKYDGCNHITCTRCKHEWCYICFAPYRHNEHGFLFCAHKDDCTEHDPFIDVVAPEFARRRARPPHPWNFFPPPPPPGFRPPPAGARPPPGGFRPPPGGFRPPPGGFRPPPNRPGNGGMHFPPPPPAVPQPPPAPPQAFAAFGRFGPEPHPPHPPHFQQFVEVMEDFEQLRFQDDARGRGPHAEQFLDTFGDFLTAVEGARHGGRRANAPLGRLDEFGVLHR